VPRIKRQRRAPARVAVAVAAPVVAIAEESL
jgi:hypothetical protein